MFKSYFGPQDALNEEMFVQYGLSDALTPAEVTGCLLQNQTCSWCVEGARRSLALLVDVKLRKDNAQRIRQDRAVARKRAQEEKQQREREKAHISDVFMKERNINATLNNVITEHSKQRDLLEPVKAS